MSTDQLVSANRTATLTTLLPSTTYTLPYTLPLLLCSLCLTFAGAFLTLDRSRSFPPKYDPIPGDFFAQKQSRPVYSLLEGGIGGLAAGYVFGVHLSTFLSLMIPSLSSSAPLSPQSFLPVWLLSGLIATFLSGRWRSCALVASGVSGGSTFALTLAIILHPSLLTRIILTAIILPTLAILTILPFSRSQHAFLRFSLSATGAFGVVLSISLFAGVQSWANVWERFWVPDGPAGQWGSSSEKGLSAAYCFLLAGGMGCDWMLRYRFGENPDQKWDSYLATYSSNLPDHAGTFRPLTPIWFRFFGLRKRQTPPVANEIVHPADDEISTLRPYRWTSIAKSSRGVGFQERLQRFCEKLGKGTRGPVKFGPDLPSSEDPDNDKLKIPVDSGRPWLEHKRSSSPPVSVGFARSPGKVEEGNIDMRRVAKVETRVPVHCDENLEYSDLEDEDVTAAAASRNRGAPGWSPDFLKRHREAGGTSTTSEQTAVDLSPAISSLPGGEVLITPSLVTAIDRIAVAQQTALGTPSRRLRPGFPSSESSEPSDTIGLPGAQAQVYTPFSGCEDDKSVRWDIFWKDVREKAALAR